MIMKNSDIKLMQVSEFRREGFLQEANRLFFHPLGLALEVNIDDNGDESLGGIWDYRDDPVGIVFGDGVIDKLKADNVQLLFESKRKEREKILPNTIQPVETSNDTNNTK